MLDRLALAFSLIAAMVPAAPAPSQSPSPSPSGSPAPTSTLKTIATIRVSARCASIITHANSAIDKTLNDDQLIGGLITYMRYINLNDGNPFHRRKALQNLRDLASTLTIQSRSGDDEVKRLRKIASQTKDPQEAKALKSFADTLGGALWDQQKIARDLNGYLAYQDFREMAKPTEEEQQMRQSTLGTPELLTPRSARAEGLTQDNGDEPWPPLLGQNQYASTATEQARAAADDFQMRTVKILHDEDDAAAKVDGAINGC